MTAKLSDLNAEDPQQKKETNFAAISTTTICRPFQDLSCQESEKSLRLPRAKFVCFYLFCAQFFTC